MVLKKLCDSLQLRAYIKKTDLWALTDILLSKWLAVQELKQKEIEERLSRSATQLAEFKIFAKTLEDKSMQRRKTIEASYKVIEATQMDLARAQGLSSH